MCALGRSLAAEAGIVTSVAIFDAAEDPELEMLMLEKLPTLTVFQLGSSVERRQLCIYTQCIARLSGTVAPDHAGLHLCVDGGTFPSKREAFGNDNFLTLTN